MNRGLMSDEEWAFFEPFVATRGALSGRRPFRRWTLSGLWDLLLEVLNDTEGVGETVRMIDGTGIRAHHCAAGARRGLRDRVPCIFPASSEFRRPVHARRRPPPQSFDFIHDL